MFSSSFTLLDVLHFFFSTDVPHDLTQYFLFYNMNFHSESDACIQSYYVMLHFGIR